MVIKSNTLKSNSSIIADLITFIFDSEVVVINPSFIPLFFAKRITSITVGLKYKVPGINSVKNFSL